MHIYFSGIGGTAIGPLALIAKQAGYEVSGSDKQGSQYIEYLKKVGVENILIGQSEQQIAEAHSRSPIDWLVYTSAAPMENPDHPEITFAKKNGIRVSKRDELLNKIIGEKDLDLIAVAGTHGKTTTTAMVVWLFKQMHEPVSYSVGAKISFGEMGHFDPASKYFVLEADEFDKNFLSYNPELSVITGIGYDHNEIYPTEADYKEAFRQFINQSRRTILWDEDSHKLDLSVPQIKIEETDNPKIDDIRLAGKYNRRDGWLAVQAVRLATDKKIELLLEAAGKFPGVSRRFEKLTDNLYTDYAHTPDKIMGAMSVARESLRPGQQLVVIYEPLTNRRMHYLAAEHKEVFSGASKIYWVPSYLAREDKDQSILTPSELIKNLDESLQAVAESTKLDDKLKNKVREHLAHGDLVLALSGGGGGSLDEWLRQEFH